MERNLFEVFGQRDSARRAAAIAELYSTDCTSFEAEEQVTGREALNAKVGSILNDAPGFVFRAAGPAQVNHDLGRLREGSLQSLRRDAGTVRHPWTAVTALLIYPPG
jgi:hypothetical protein